MRQQDVINTIRIYLVEQILDSPQEAIEVDTPLLEWGILNSLSTVRLVGFIREHFELEIPIEEMVGENFRNIDTISALACRLDSERTDDFAGR